MKLTKENINDAVLKSEEFLKSAKIDSKDILRIRLSVEEILLTYAEKFGEDKDFVLKAGKLFGKVRIVISVPGESYNPFSESDELNEVNVFMRSMLTTLGKRPVWSYLGRINTLTFIAERKSLPDWIKIVIAMLLGVGCGLIVKSLPSSVGTFIQSSILSPVLDTFIGFLNAIAGPLIFLSVMQGICSMGNVNTFNTVGKKLTIRFFLYLVISMIIASFVVFWIYDFDFGESSEGGGFDSIFGMILDIVPDNLLTPFTSGNTLQILFLGIVFGIIMIVVGERTSRVTELVEQLNPVVQRIMSTLSKIIPVYIFGSIVNIIVTSDVSVLLGTWKFVVGGIIASLIVCVIHVLHTAVVTKKSPLHIIKKSFPTFIIAFTTASSTAAFSSNVKVCKDGYGIDEKLVNFGVPFVQVLYKPGSAMLFFIVALTMAEVCGMTISFAWILIAFFLSILLSCANPPIPGGSIAGFTVLFLQMGIPLDNLAVIIGLYTVVDFFFTSANVLSGQLMLLDEYTSEKNKLGLNRK